MPFSKFETIEEVAEKFDIEVNCKPFIQQAEMQIPEYLFSRLTNKIADNAHFINEYAICEHIIAPILDLVVERYNQLRVWSRMPYNVDKENDLIGEPDYLIAPKTKYGGMAVPPICIIEAKKERFDEGWAQALAEMVASSLQGIKVSYGIVTTGKIWEFGKLANKLFTKDTDQVSATRELQTLFNMLNWLFNEANTTYHN
jgi:hypothetical protein